MASLKELKGRINSVKSTQKITKAKQMVAAAKLRKAQTAAEAARPYAGRLAAVMASIAGIDQMVEEVQGHPGVEVRAHVEQQERAQQRRQEAEAHDGGEAGQLQVRTRLASAIRVRFPQEFISTITTGIPDMFACITRQRPASLM